jgi:hypothetical protein
VVRIEKWKSDFDEVAVTLRQPEEFDRLRRFMSDALTAAGSVIP